MARATNTGSSYETWEAVGKGAVWVTLTDDRGRETERQIGGPKGAARLRIKIEDRQAMQDAFPDVNPFESGRLRRVDAGAPAEQPAKTDDELLATLASPSLEDDLLTASEFNVRRLKDLAEAGGSTAVSVAQLHTIKNVIDRRWPPIQPPSDQLEAASER